MLLGRDPERHALDAALADARLNRSAVIVLAGDVGIGKTTLLEYAAEQAGAAGMRVLRARGIESEARVPFAGLLELLRPALGGLEQIPEPQRAALEGALALRPATAQDRFAVGAATLSLLAAHAEGAPVAAFVDDAQWLDGSTADALLFAIRRLVADPIAVVRRGARGRGVVRGRGTVFRRSTLGGLDREAAAALVGDDARRPPVRGDRREPARAARACVAATRPTDLPIDTPVPIAGSVAQGFVRRAESLPEATQRALLVAAASDTGESAAARAGAPRSRSRTSSRRSRPVSSRSRTAASSSATSWRGRRSTGPRRPTSVVPRIARSPVRCRTATPTAARGISRSPPSARTRPRPPRSSRPAAARTTEAPTTSQPRLSSAQRLCHCSRPAWSTEALTQPGSPARRIARSRCSTLPSRGTDDLRLTLAIEHLRGQITARRGPVREARSILAAAAERAAAFDPELAVVMLAEATVLSFYAGDALAMVATAGRATELAAGLDGRAAILAGLAYGMALVFAGEGDSGARSIRRAVARLEASDELRDDPYLVVWAAHGPLWLREAEAGRGLYERALALVRSRAALGAIPELLVHVARDWATTDEWPAAHAAYSEAVALARETGQDVALAFGLAGLAWLEARQGREADCRAHAAEGREACIRAGVTVHELWTIAALGDLEFGLGRPEAALEHYLEWDTLLWRAGSRTPTCRPRRSSRRRCCVWAGTRRRQHMQLGTSRAPAPRVSRGRSPARHARVACSHPTSELEREFDEAIDLHGQTPDVFEAARTRLAYGARLRRAGRRVDARDELRAAIEAFDSLGAEPWSNLARVELEATGETARKRDPSTLDQLTPQELQIALLLADGRTTREAAASMFLSPKTIEYHLRNVYRKLGVHSRPELSEAMARLR